MNYELCKQLKHAGFPNTRDFIDEIKNGWIYDDETLSNFDNTHDTDECVMRPTLSELIESCGDKLRTLMNCDDDGWRAYGRGGAKIYHDGKNPEEAIAKLWLILR